MYHPQANSSSGCKITKKNPNVQNFGTLGVFGTKKKKENNFFCKKFAYVKNL